MTHRAEQIMAAVTAALTGLATTGANAVRARHESIEIEKTPALAIWQGDEEVLAELSGDTLIVGLEINIDGVSAKVAGGVDTELNQIRVEVTAALAADHTLGLSWMYDIHEVHAEAPEIRGTGDRPHAVQRLRWLATYKRNRVAASV